MSNEEIKHLQQTKTAIVTLAYCRPHIAQAALSRYDNSTFSDVPKHHRLLVDCCYPVPDINVNSKELQQVADNAGITYVKLASNQGVTGNYGQIFAHIEHAMPDIEYVAFFDPDSAPLSRTWLSSMLTVLHEKEAAYVSLSRPVADREQRGAVMEVSGLRAKRLTHACGWPMGAYSMKFARQCEWRWRPYGFMEDYVLSEMKRVNMAGFILLDEIDNGFSYLQEEYDPEYQLWKAAEAHGHTTLQFEEWLKERQAQ